MGVWGEGWEEVFPRSVTQPTCWSSWEGDAMKCLFKEKHANLLSADQCVEGSPSLAWQVSEHRTTALDSYVPRQLPRLALKAN